MSKRVKKAQRRVSELAGEHRLKNRSTHGNGSKSTCTRLQSSWTRYISKSLSKAQRKLDAAIIMESFSEHCVSVKRERKLKELDRECPEWSTWEPSKEEVCKDMWASFEAKGYISCPLLNSDKVRAITRSKVRVA